MNNTGKILLIVFVILYIISPLDFAPGPLDDLMVLMLGLAARKRIDED